MIKELNFTKKNIIITIIISLAIIVVGAQVTSLVYKQEASDIKSEFATWWDKINSGNNSTPDRISVTNYKKAIDYDNRILTAYNTSKRWSPLSVSQNDVDKVNSEIKYFEVEMQLTNEYDLFNTEYSNKDWKNAKTQIYAIIDLVQSNDITSEVEAAYYNLAVTLASDKQAGDSYDDVISALDKTTNLASKNITIKQIVMDSQYSETSSKISPRVLNLYGHVLINASVAVDVMKSADAVPFLNLAIKNEDLMLKNENELKTYKAETYYYLAMAYGNSRQLSKATDSAVKCLENAPDNQTYKDRLPIILTLAAH